MTVAEKDAALKAAIDASAALECDDALTAGLSDLQLYELDSAEYLGESANCLKDLVSPPVMPGASPKQRRGVAISMIGRRSRYMSMFPSGKPSLVDSSGIKSARPQWKHISEKSLIDDLKERILNPKEINQGRYGTCGIVTYGYFLARVYPQIFVHYVLTAFYYGAMRGQGAFYRTSKNMRDAKPGTLKGNQKMNSADWVFMATVAENIANHSRDYQDKGAFGHLKHKEKRPRANNQSSDWRTNFAGVADTGYLRERDIEGDYGGTKFSESSKMCNDLLGSHLSPLFIRPIKHSRVYGRQNETIPVAVKTDIHGAEETLRIGSPIDDIDKLIPGGAWPCTAAIYGMQAGQPTMQRLASKFSSSAGEAISNDITRRFIFDVDRGHFAEASLPISVFTLANVLATYGKKHEKDFRYHALNKSGSFLSPEQALELRIKKPHELTEKISIAPGFKWKNDSLHAVIILDATVQKRNLPVMRQLDSVSKDGKASFQATHTPPMSGPVHWLYMTTWTWGRELPISLPVDTWVSGHWKTEDRFNVEYYIPGIDIAFDHLSTCAQPFVGALK
jgi:hypothetical protein